MWRRILQWLTGRGRSDTSSVEAVTRVAERSPEPTPGAETHPELPEHPAPHLRATHGHRVEWRT